MRFSSLRIFSVISLFAIWSTALPATDVGVANRLEKRIPRDDAANAVHFDASVSAADRIHIQMAIREMIDLATEAAQLDYRSIRRGMYTRWLPAGKEDQVKSVFKYLAGIPQYWGEKHRGQYDFSRITFSRRTGSNPFVQADTDIHLRLITIYDFGMRTPMRNDITPQRVGTRTSYRMEFLGAVLLHEMFHVTEILTDTLCAPGAAAINREYCTVDDQEQTVAPGVRVKSYGPWLAKRLKDRDAGLAFLNNDNYMYLALEAYWSVAGGVTSWSSPKVEVLPHCAMAIGNFMHWCWER